jgi:ABC-type microcin C transport system duplicated ATPase subunit YejF
VTDSLLQVRDLVVRYPLGRPRLLGARREIEALAGVSVDIAEGGTLGVVGESGSGKSTLARAVLGFVRPASGRILWRGTAIDSSDRDRMRRLRREVQVVFQDPFGSLDPRMTARESIEEALEALEGLTGPAADERVVDALGEVGLDPSLRRRYPHELSGGQCQRVAIARATVVRPDLLICDEAVSALDVSIQAQIVNLLRDLCERHGMALLFISHNLAVVRHLCADIAVLRAGCVVERADRETLFSAPQDPYTRSLLAAASISSMCSPDGPSMTPVRRPR